MITKSISRFICFSILALLLLSSCSPSQSLSGDQTGDFEQDQNIETDDNPGAVAILVIDDFGFDVYMDPSSPPSIDREDACPVTTSGQVHAGSSGMTFVLSELVHAGSSGMDYEYEVEVSDKPHGLLVYDKFSQLFEDGGAPFRDSKYDEFNLEWMGLIESWDFNGYSIYLVQIDTSGYDTDEITRRIRESINILADTWNIQRFVLNMSFGVVPCDIKEDLSAYNSDINEDASLAELESLFNELMVNGFANRVSLEGLDPNEKYEYLKGLIRTNLAYVEPSSGKISEFGRDTDDPLYEYLNELPSEIRVVAVASAGNSSINFPFAPAIWKSVISVSAYPFIDKENLVLGYSNSGEVIMDGEFRGKLGTSFSAPELSYEAALYLLKGGYHYYVDTGALICEGAGGTNTTSPPLTYAGLDGPWSNLKLDDAAAYCCTDFLELAQVNQPYSGEIVQIRWFVGLGTGTAPEQVVEQQAVVDTFNASQDHIEVILEVVPYDSARDTLSTQIAAGNGPDLIGPVGIGGSNDFYGQWMDLTPLMKAAKYDTSVFNKALIEFYQTEEGQVGLPWMVFPTALYYQPSLFDEAGLNYPPANIGDQYKMPDGSMVDWSWETLTEVAKMLTIDVNGLTPFDNGFDRENIVQVGYVPQWSGMWVVGTFWEPGLVYAGEAGAYTVAIPPAWKDAVKWAFDGIWGDQPFIANGALAGSAEFGSGNVFGSGRAAMGQTQLWYTCCMADAGEWDIASFPSYNGVYHGRMDADTVRMWKGSKHPEEAFEFLTWLIGPGGTEPLIMAINSVEPGYAAYGGFPALTEYQAMYFETKQEQFPWVTNWQLFDQALAYPDNPSAEAWKPNSVEANNRMDTFWNLVQNDSTIDFDAEWANLEADLEVIFNK